MKEEKKICKKINKKNEISSNATVLRTEQTFLSSHAFFSPILFDVTRVAFALLRVCVFSLSLLPSPGHYFNFRFCFCFSYLFIVYLYFYCDFCFIHHLFSVLLSATPFFFPWHIDFHWYDDENKTDWLSDYMWMTNRGIWRAREEAKESNS